jgi:phosphoglycolate phosphatase-like HAD superfamily hydrolase
MTSIAYDFDGTIVDVKARQMGLLRTISKSFDLEIKEEQIWLDKREGLNNVAALLKQDIRMDLALNIDQIWRSEIETTFWLNLDTKIIQRIDELNKFRNWDCKTFLISARKHPCNLIQQLETLDLTHHFDEVICVDPTVKVKDKALFLNALGIDLFIGDTEADFSSSQLANVIFYGVTTGQRSRKFLEGTGVRYIDVAIDKPVNFKNPISGPNRD